MEHTEEKLNMVNTLSICVCWLATFFHTPDGYACDMCK